MFEHMPAAPADAILRTMVEHRDDPRTEKIDLGVGVYRTPEGMTPVLASVKVAEQTLIDSQTTKTYLGSSGSADFNAAMTQLTYGNDDLADRLVTLQTPGGSGSLRVAAGAITEAGMSRTVWVGEPTWANHVPLLGKAGLELKTVPYYDRDTHSLREDDYLEALSQAAAGDIALLHACCHNPSGIDPSPSQWKRIADLIVEHELVPMIDMAYQGFGDGLDEDALIIRELAGRVPEMIVCNSCSKNFGLYRDRVGALSILVRDSATRERVQSQCNTIVRTLYSMPPDHGAAVVSIILSNAALRSQWENEVADMRTRISGMRHLLHDALTDKAPGRDFGHLVRARGMFCFLGITPEQVGRLKKHHAVYMVDSSRINVAGINADNVDYLATSIAAVLD
ncbi:MAG: amino acid aminotransferase [Pseudomonadota bacterium]